MKSYIVKLNAQLTTVSPVFIGCGETLGKKEYVLDRKTGIVNLFNMDKLFSGLIDLNLDREYEKFMENGSGDMENFLADANVPRKTWMNWVQFKEPAADTTVTGKNVREIERIIRDPYGNPYIPGTSLKGALRTILLCSRLLKDPDVREKVTEDIKSERFTGRTRYLSFEDKYIDHALFHKCDHDVRKVNDETNDILRGLIVSDSAPIKGNSLCICQKIDQDVYGKAKPLPILRECIKPGVTVSFTISIDTSVCKIDRKEILHSIRDFYAYYQDVFMNKFRDAPKVRGNSTTFFLGGGSGYVSKTGTYAALDDDRDAVRIVGSILNKTLPKSVQKKHGHLKDVTKGVSPHLLKCTSYNGKMYQMGACSLTKLSTDAAEI